MKHPNSVTFFYTRLLCIMLTLCARVSYGTVLTSVASGDWNSTATWDCGCLPGSADAVVITANYTVTLTASDTVQAVTIDLNGVLNNPGDTLNLQEISPGAGTTFTINGEYTGSGATRWLTNTDATTTIITGTGIVSTSGLWTITSTSAGATINATPSLNFSSSSGIYISGGTLYCSGTITLASGYISVGTSKKLQIESTGNLTLTAGNINIGTNGIVNNYGMITVGGNINGMHVVSSKWYNFENSSLTVAGSFLYNGGTYKGTLYANYSENTINYNGAADQVVRRTTFWHLKCSNSGAKTVYNNAGGSTFVTINGDLTIQDNARFNFATNGTLTLLGNWVNTSANADPFDESSIYEVSFQGTAAQSISSTVAGGETFGTLTIYNGAGVTLNNCSVNVNNGLDLYLGLINTGLYEVNLIGYVYITNGSYINGNLRRSIAPAGGSYDFPVGNANGYQLVNINFTAAHDVGNLLVNFSNPASGILGLPLTDASGQYINVLNCGGAAPGTGNANDGVWTITPNTGTATYDITLYGNNYDNQQAAHTVLKRTDASSAWELAGTYQWSNLTEPIIAARTGLSGFSQFAIGGSANALPIELLNFEALAKDNEVELSWTTATETNNDYFTVEKTSPDPSKGEELTFVPIGTVKGAGNSSAPLNYRFADGSPLSLGEGQGVRYYRLKQTDFDGKFSYSSIVSVSPRNPASISIYPNPASSNVNLSIPGTKEELVSISVIDKLGRTILKKTENMKEGQNYFNLDVSALNTGVYLLQIGTPSGVIEQKPLMIN